MEFRVLGSLVLVDGEREIMLTSAHQRRLLAALLLDPGCPVSAGPLVDALWGEDPPASAATTVQSYVSRLRRVLGPGLLQRSPGGYLLAAAPSRPTRDGSSGWPHAAGPPTALPTGSASWRRRSRSGAGTPSPTSRTTRPARRRPPGWRSCAPPAARTGRPRCSPSAGSPSPSPTCGP